MTECHLGWCTKTYSNTLEKNLSLTLVEDGVMMVVAAIAPDASSVRGVKLAKVPAGQKMKKPEKCTSLIHSVDLYALAHSL